MSSPATTTEWNLLERVEERAEFFREHDAEGEPLGRLPDAVAQALRDTGVVRALQPKTFGGYEMHPAEFMKAVLQIGRRSGSAGWVAGVIGIHTQELAQADLRVQQEIWGEDPDTWVASPYMAKGIATPVEGGYRFSGRWQFSSGTDHSDWVIIGGLIADADGTPNPDPYHFILPRGDYEIVQDSWQVMGLKGTGSKHLIVDDAFVPDYRVIHAASIDDNTYADRLGLANPLYRIPQNIIFGATINAGTLAMTLGVMDAFIDWTAKRIVRKTGIAASTDPYRLTIFGEASADIEASITNFLHGIDRMYDIAAEGRLPTEEEHWGFRRAQTRDTARAVLAADRIYTQGGGGAMDLDQPLQRMWRDMHGAMNHGGNIAEPNYHKWGLARFGHPVV